jgi:hypothetical protein
MINPSLYTVTGVRGLHKPLDLISQADYICLQWMIEKMVNPE